MTAVYIIAGIIALLIILAAAAPKNYNVSRSIEINKPLAEVFNYIKMVKNQDEWSPWKKRDPNMIQTSEGTDGTVGYVSKWTSDHKQVGEGEQEIKLIKENEVMESELRFFKPFKSVSNGFLKTEAMDNNKTRVIWGFHGTHKIPVNIMMLFFNMDKAVGKDFEEGLADLKTTLENK